jgi:predicted ATP-grasp superfamily ATP-dependent carboligase
MLEALAGDFSRVPGVRVWTLPRPRLERDRRTFRRIAARADWSVVIAPEFEGILLDLCREVESVGGRLLGPSPAIVALAGDKWACYHHLLKAGIPTSRTWLVSDPRVPDEARFPLVQKPLDGAGSIDTFLVRNPEQIQRRPGFLLQEFVPGTPASVALLCGPDRIVPLVPAYQVLSDDGEFRYLGGRLPLPKPLAARAVHLATRAVESLAYPRGYLGVDLVLGEDEGGSGDAVIEINPRLTTSYVGLRALAEGNLAEAMLRIARGQRFRAIRWKPGSVAFRPEGSVE